MTLPLLEVRGSARQRGRQHGEALAADIGHNLARYLDRFEREVEIPRPQLSEIANLYVELFGRYHPDYLETMRGIAEGSGIGFEDIALLNARYEILYYGFGAADPHAARPDGCTSFGLLPGRTDSGHLLIGENWDWIPDIRGALILSETGGVRTLAFTEAGIAGEKIGLNSCGLGLVINGLTSMADDWRREAKPLHLRTYQVLRQRTFDDALALLSEDVRACSTHFLLAQAPDRLLGIEAGPLSVRQLQPDGGSLVHANHFIDPARLDLEEPHSVFRERSLQRHDRIAGLMRQPRLGVEQMMEVLRDSHGAPDAICRSVNHDDADYEHYATVVSVVMDLTERSLWISDGPPSHAPYERYRL